MNIKEAQDFKNYAVKHHGLSSMHLENYTKKVSLPHHYDDLCKACLSGICHVEKNKCDTKITKITKI